MRRTIILLFWILLCGTNPAFTQTDSISNPLKYSLKGNLSGSLITGTFQQFSIAPSLDFKVFTKRWEVHTITRYRFNNTNGLVIENNWYELITFSYFTQKNRLLPIAFYHFDNNVIFRVNRRHLAGIGVSSLKETDHWIWRFSAGLGYDDTEYNGEEFVNSERIGAVRRRSLFIGGIRLQNQFFDKKLNWSHDLFYGHSLIEGDDFFFRYISQLSWKIAKPLSITARYEHRFEHVHLTSLSGLNTILLFGLTYTVGN